MSSPTKRAYLKWEENNASNDFLQLSDGSGRILGWIDPSGVPNGSLAPASTGTTTPFLGAPSGSCSPTQTAVDTTTGNFYSCQSGAWTLVGPTAGSLVSPITSPNPLAFDVNVHFKGPNPYTDVTRYGVRSTVVDAVPAIPGITASISSNVATLSSASSFQNGDGVAIYGAGAAGTIITPTGLVVAPSLAAAGTGTGILVAGLIGSSTYNYQVIARDAQGALTAASSVATTVTGASSLGSQSVAVSGYTRSGVIVTATTSSAHGLVVGAHICITNGTASDNLFFGGWFIVASVPDNTHFTFLTGNDTAEGAPSTSSGGGTVYWWNCNHISWTPVVGASHYYIYGRTGGSLTLIGVSRPQNVIQSITDATWDDFGSPMMDGILLPYFVPSTPPSSAQARPLVTTILSGAGTTSLTLATSASTAVSGATIVFDNAPNIASAAAAIGASGLVYFPSGTYVVNSYLAYPSSAPMLLAGATLFLNDVMEIHGGGGKIFGMLAAQGSNSLSFGWPVGGFISAPRANPGIWVTSGTGFYMNGIQISGAANGQLLMCLDGGPGGAQCQIWNSNFSNGGSGDYMGMNLLARGGFWNRFDTVTFETGPGQSGGGFIGSTATPAAFFNSSGSATFRYMSIQDRGILFVPATAGTNVEFTGTTRCQGIITPVFTQSGVCCSAHAYTFSDVEIDTANSPLFANLSGSASVTIDPGVNGFPSSGYGLVTGIGLDNLVGGTGQNFAAISGSYFSSNFVNVSGTGQVGYAMATPAVPASASVSSGGSVPVGTHVYAITAVDMNGVETLIGPSVAVTTTSGNQTVTVTPPTLPLGSKAWRPYRDGVLANVTPCSTATLSPTATYVDISASACNNNPPTSNLAAAVAVSAIGFSGFQSAYAPTLFANLGTPSNGVVLYCADCNIANPCTGSGTGAIAKRLNGSWICN